MSTDYSNDIFLLKALKNNDLEAFEHLYKQQRNRLFVLANSILENRELSKDIVQEIFMELLEKNQFAKIDSAVKTYLYRLVRNRSLNLLRDRSVASKREARFIADKLREEGINEVEGIEYNMDKNEMQRTIINAMAELPPMAEKVFQLHYIENYTHVEIADKLGISRFTVANHITRALKGLRMALQKIS